VADARSPHVISTSRATGVRSRLRRRTVVITFAAIVLVTFLLRIFYSSHLYQDDGLWFTAAEEVLRGKVLYRDVYFDKPPGIALVYAALFKLFGTHILTIRLFTIVYCVTVSAALYRIGKRLYGERVGLTAAMMFALFSTIYATGHVQGLNTDFLMVLPYTAAMYWLLRSCDDVFGRPTRRRQSATFAVAGGACVALAMQINPKGMFDLAFFALFLLVAHFWKRKEKEKARVGEGENDNEHAGPAPSQRLASIPPLSHSPTLPLVFSFVGFALGTLPFVIYLTVNHALSFYWLYVWDWGARYARYYPASHMFFTAVGQTVNYFLLNNALLITLLFVTVTVFKRMKRARLRADVSAATSEPAFRADVALLLWFAASYLGMSVGGRFYGHYFFQVLPALSLIGGRGLTSILTLADEGQGDEWPERPANATGIIKRRRWQRILIVLLVIGFAITMVRFHTRTLQLAADWLRGRAGQSDDDWFHGRLKDEERQVAATVRNIDMEPEEAARQPDAEALRHGGPRERAPEGPSDYLFVWGYRPELYYWSGLLPASKYLSTQPLTGVPGDAHYHSVHYHLVLDERDTAAARRELAEELARTQPEYIIDELGFFNDNLAMPRYSEFDDVLSRYKRTGTVKRFIIYRRRDLIKAGKREKQSAEAGEKER
jgi:hypothetical protein